MDSDDVKGLAAVIAGIVLIAAIIFGGIYVQQHEPCSWFKYSRLTSVPARCLSYFEQR